MDRRANEGDKLLAGFVYGVKSVGYVFTGRKSGYCPEGGCVGAGSGPGEVRRV